VRYLFYTLTTIIREKVMTKKLMDLLYGDSTFAEFLALFVLMTAGFLLTIVIVVVSYHAPYVTVIILSLYALGYYKYYKK